MISEAQHELLKDIFSNTERTDKMSISLDPVSRSLTVRYEDLDDEWFKEMQAVAPTVATQPLALGDYVLATKYFDGDPGDPWALGFYAGELDMGNDRCAIKVAPRYMVKDSAGNNIRGNGYRRVSRIRPAVGNWLLNVAAKQLEQSPPGTVNLWTMLTPSAFEDDSV